MNCDRSGTRSPVRSLCGFDATEACFSLRFSPDDLQLAGGLKFREHVLGLPAYWSIASTLQPP